MKNYVTDTNAGQAISAYVVLDKKREEVAIVRIFHGTSCLVNVFDKKLGFQHARCGGSGLDKQTAALVGLIIDGHMLNDHCSRNDASEKMLKAYLKEAKANGGMTKDAREKWNIKAKKIGAYFANFDTDKKCHLSLFLASGLDRLKMLGYTVIQAI